MKNTINALNTLLAAQEVFTTNLQNYHWYIKGGEFFTLHGQLEELYDAMRDDFDKTAELILMIDGQPLSRMSDFLKASPIAEAESGFISAKDTLKALEEGYASLLKLVEEVPDENRVVTAAMDDMASSYTKNRWMIRQASR